MSSGDREEISEAFRTAILRLLNDPAFYKLLRKILKRLEVLVLVAFLFASCSAMTVSPLPAVVSHQASFDANQQNSGVLSCDADGCLVTQHFIDRHGFKAGERGISKDGKNYLLTGETMEKAIELDQSRKKVQHQ